MAAALVAARTIGFQQPRRSIIVAFWDAEEDGLVGARHYAINPIVPLEQTVAYVNVDLIGASLLPSLVDRSLAIGAETGGAALQSAVADAASGSGIELVPLSVIFGQGRSDHAPFVESGVPAVFFNDGTNGCYHTVLDDIEHLDDTKLARQVDIVTDLLAALVATDDPPTFDPDAPAVVYDDAVALLDMLEQGEDDLDLLGSATARAVAYLEALRVIVDQGPSEFDDVDIGILLAGAAELVDALANQECR